MKKCRLCSPDYIGQCLTIILNKFGVKLHFSGFKICIISHDDDISCWSLRGAIGLKSDDGNCFTGVIHTRKAEIAVGIRCGGRAISPFRLNLARVEVHGCNKCLTPFLKDGYATFVLLVPPTFDGTNDSLTPVTRLMDFVSTTR